MQNFRTTFMSHAHPDNARCGHIAELLKAMNIDLWIDLRNLQRVHALPTDITRELVRRQALVLMVTHASDASPWVGYELNKYLAYSLDPAWRIVDGQQRLIIPVRLEPITRRPDAEESNWAKVFDYSWIDGVGKSDEKIAAAIAAELILAAECRNPSPTPNAVPHQPSPSPTSPNRATHLSRRALLTGVGALVVIGAGIGVALEVGILNEHGTTGNRSNTTLGATRWRYRTGGAVRTSPVVANGLIYVGSDDGLVYALNTTTGTPRWQVSVDDNGAPTPQFSTSFAVANGLVYLGSPNGLYFSVAALDASTGGRHWANLVFGEPSTSPTVANGLVYVGSGDHSVYAFDATTGAGLWGFQTGGVVKSTPKVADSLVYVGSFDGSVYALDTSAGFQRWSFQTGNQVSSSPAVANGLVYVGSDDHSVYALDAYTGAKRWSFRTGGAVSSSPAVINGLVYVGSDDGSVYALNVSSGVKRWSFRTNGAVRSSPAVANGSVYVGSYDHSVYALDATTGAKRWAFRTGGEVFSSPTVANGLVYIGSDDGLVYAFDA